jgi:hypothetical protein
MDQNMALLLTAYEKLYSIDPLIVAADGRIRKSLFSPIRTSNSNQLPVLSRDLLQLAQPLLGALNSPDGSHRRVFLYPKDLAYNIGSRP